MTAKKKPQWDDPEESKRFLETAKAVEASENPKDLEKALAAVASERMRGHGK